MTKSDITPDRIDRITCIVTALCVAGMLVVMAMNGMIEFGEVAHDALCPDHGWAV